MAILYDEQAKTLTLHTKSSTYQMKIDEIGTLLHTYYGARTDESDMSYAIFRMARGYSGNPHEKGTVDRSYSFDMLPQEISCFGTGDYRITALKVLNEDGSRALRLRFDSYEIREGKYSLPGLPASYDEAGKAQTLIVRMKDTEAKVSVTLYYGVFEENDVITRSVRIRNLSREAKHVLNPGSMSLDFLEGAYDLITFYGKWAMERQPERRRIPHGITAIGSVRGASSPHYNPSAILCEPSATEDYGQAYGMTFMYSGEYLLQVEKDQTEATRVTLGIHPDDFDWTLEYGDTFVTPEVILTYSGEGLSKLSQNFHRFISKHVVRGPWRDRRRPILINNWEGTYFDFNGEKLISIANEAHALGCELFVMDDGWFGKRDDDNSGLGDWYPNERKLGMTLGELGKRITASGMRFGIWFEPETISEDSDLYRAHPDWAIRIPGRAADLSRNELLLDMSRTEVQNYITERMLNVLHSAPISYVKWDFNRHMCDKYSAALPKERQGELAHRFMLGTYRVLDALLTEFPELLIEGCASGGGRFDTGMLYYTPQIWCSDDSEAIERLSIQYGTSFIYPVSTMGAHVSAVPNHQTGRVTPFETRAIVAMSGTFGYELDVNKLTDAEKAEMKREIAVFKAVNGILQRGRYYRLTVPGNELGVTAWEQVTDDGRTAVVNAVYHYVHANPAPAYVYLKGLDPDVRYRMKLVKGHGGQKLPSDQKLLFDGTMTLTGRTLMNRGIYIPVASKEYQSWQIIIQAV